MRKKDLATHSSRGPIALGGESADGGPWSRLCAQGPRHAESAARPFDSRADSRPAAERVSRFAHRVPPFGPGVLSAVTRRCGSRPGPCLQEFAEIVDKFLRRVQHLRHRALALLSSRVHLGGRHSHGRTRTPRPRTPRESSPRTRAHSALRPPSPRPPSSSQLAAEAGRTPPAPPRPPPPPQRLRSPSAPSRPSATPPPTSSSGATPTVRPR